MFLEGLAKILSQWTDRPVVDITGLSGAYDLKLEWSESTAPADQQKPSVGMPVHPMEVMRASTDPTAILRSLASVGLRAQRRKAPLKFLIVDHAEKLPTEN